MKNYVIVTRHVKAKEVLQPYNIINIMHTHDDRECLVIGTLADVDAERLQKDNPIWLKSIQADCGVFKLPKTGRKLRSKIKKA